MKFFLVLLTVALVLAVTRWPSPVPAIRVSSTACSNGLRAVTTESFLVVRGDDGAVYYVGIAAARRDGPLAAGARVSVLGLEGRAGQRDHGARHRPRARRSGAALANLQGARPAPAPTAVTPPAAVAVTTPTATPGAARCRAAAGPSTASVSPSAPSPTAGRHATGCAAHASRERL